MIKKINISEEVVARLVKSNRCIDGSLHFDKETGKITFKAYNRKSPSRQQDSLIKKLPWGWVKESMERIKVFGSFPKDLGVSGILGQIEEHSYSAKSAVVDWDLINQ